jgi:hypothetical protein
MRTVRTTTANIDAEESAAVGTEECAGEQRRALGSACLTATLGAPGLHLQRSFSSGAPLTMDSDV